jgi:hypothetical protein
MISVDTNTDSLAYSYVCESGDAHRSGSGRRGFLLFLLDLVQDLRNQAASYRIRFQPSVDQKTTEEVCSDEKRRELNQNID